MKEKEESNNVSAFRQLFEFHQAKKRYSLIYIVYSLHRVKGFKVIPFA